MTAAERAARTRILFLDVDGVLTDGRLHISARGIARSFHTLDGFGIRALIKSGVPVALVSAAGGEDIQDRARHLGIARVHLHTEDKLAVVREVLHEESLVADAAAYMGDDIPDLAAMRYVGFAVAPQTAAAEVAAAAHWTPARPAGAGAVRELCDFILQARG